VRQSEIEPWLALGWIDCGPSHLPGWCLLTWEAPGIAVAPFSAYLAEASGRGTTHRQSVQPAAVYRETNAAKIAPDLNDLAAK
jgi:hypothetical protein